MNYLKKILTNKFLYIALSIVVFFGATSLYVLDRWIMPAYTNYNEGITVPDVTKLSLVEAQELLDQYGFRHEIHDRRAHSAYPADYIIDQNPSARQIVKPNRKIYLTVNTVERQTVVVPDVVNMSLRNATIQIENNGLQVGTISMESARFRNTVLRQTIASGDTVEQGTVVDLTVSDGLGGEIVDIPELEGLLLPEAQQELLAAGLRIGEVRFQPERDVSPNTVLSYSAERSELREGDSVNLIVSERFDAQEADEAGAVVNGDEDENGLQDIDSIDEAEDDNEGSDSINQNSDNNDE